MNAISLTPQVRYRQNRALDSVILPIDEYDELIEDLHDLAVLPSADGSRWFRTPKFPAG